MRGTMLVHDYSQLELRFGAWMCEDPVMIRALTLDIHWINLGIIEKICKPAEIPTMTQERSKEIAEDIHKLYLKDVAKDRLPAEFFTSDSETVRDTLADAAKEDKILSDILYQWENKLEKRRTVAKKNSFGPFYGMTPQSFAIQNGVSIEFAEELFEIDRKTYPDKHAWIKETKARARKDCMVRSVFGKVRHLDYKARNADVEELDRQGVNTVIQGPASDLNLLACCEII